MKRLKSLLITSPFVMLFALLLLMEFGIETVSANEWHTETVDSVGEVGHDTSSLALDPNTGYPRISYWDEKNYDLKYAVYDGSTWQIETVDNVVCVGGTIHLLWTRPQDIQG